jgi:1-acyl-sn-glycerol-3-phosphate acyltransferase
VIPSAKSRWFVAWFERQAWQRLRASVGALHLAGREHLEHALARGPVLVVSNHCAWWDPLVALVLTHRFVPADAYALMDAANLRQRPFFAKVGAFGVDRGSRRDGAAATRHAVGLLDRPGRLVWVFPQGEERPQHERPLRFFGGAASVARRVPGLSVVPVGLAYAFGATAAPSVLVAVGEPVAAEPTAAGAVRAQVHAVQAQLARIEHELARPGTQGFESHLLQRPRWLERVAERALAVLTRPLVPGLDARPSSADGSAPALAPARSELAAAVHEPSRPLALSADAAMRR